MAFPSFLDACTLYGSYVRDTFLRTAEAGAFRPVWSAGVLDELEGALIRNGAADSTNAARVKRQMRSAFPDAEVTGYEPLIEGMTCDQKDRHVLAAAVRARVEVLVTFNVRDFPEASTKPYDVQIVHPDEFLLDQIDLYPGVVTAVLRQQVADYDKPRLQEDELLAALAAGGVPKFAEEARRHLTSKA